MRTLRTLLILIGRQFTDDGPYVVGVFSVAALCLLVLGVLAFIYPRGLLLSEVFVFAVLPVVIGTALFAFALAQTYADRDALGLLLVLSPRLPILLARLAVGAVFTAIMIGVLSLAITGGIMSGLIRWPASFSLNERINLFASLFEVGLASYCLGLMAAQKGRTFSAALRAWPLILVVVSLIIAKGIGWALTIPLVALIAVSLLYLLTIARHPRLATITIGLVVLMLTLLPLYWLRYSLDVVTAQTMLEASNEASVVCYYTFPLRQSSGSYPENHFTVHSEVYGPYFPFLERIGIVKYFRSRKSTSSSVNRWFWQGRWSMSYDAQRGCFFRRSEVNVLYAGTQAMADEWTDQLGRFVSPVVCRVGWDEALVFDRQDSRFYSLDFGAQHVRSGPRVAENMFRHLMGITSIPDHGSCPVGGRYPSARDEDVLYAVDDSGAYVPLIDDSGAIAVLDLRTWNLITGAGHLPAPHTWCGRGSPRPRDLSGCSIRVIIKQPEKEYAGLLAASLSRQGAPLTVVAFDNDGRSIGEDHSAVPVRPWLTTKYLIESLHPPVLTVASFFTAYSFDAGATHRAIFLMPNSFVAQQRDRQTSLFFQLLWAIVFMLPAMLFAGFLSGRVASDARVIGLSAWARRVWMVGTFLFGLPAYITYRLMRPECVLMVCRECGRGRRLDRDVCHHCGSGWDSPELEPPAWRVIGHQQKMGAQS